MYELNGARFLEKYVLTSIQNGSQPVPLNEPCLVHNLDELFADEMWYLMRILADK